MFRTTLLAPFLIAGAALAIASAPAIAATTTPTHAATRAVPAKPATPARKLAVAKRATPAVAAKPAVPARSASVAKPRSHAGMVTTTLANGKKVTYDCHLAGNKTKTACKGVS